MWILSRKSVPFKRRLHPSAFTRILYNMELIFGKAKAAESTQIGILFEKGKQFLKAQGIQQWQGSHSPSAAVAEADIRKGIGYVLRTPDGEVAAYAAIIPGEDPSYLEIDGQWICSGPYCAIHRVVVSDTLKGKGVAKQLLGQCMQEAKKLGARSVRIDTHAHNQIMQKVILHSGFIYCGEITLFYGAKRNAYEIILSPEC